MPAARPSVASVSNVVRALKSAGAAALEVQVASDGSFVVRETTLDQQAAAPSPIPRWDDVQG